MSRSIPYTLMILAKSNYKPLKGSLNNDNGLPYLAKHKHGKVICLRSDGKTYRPMGKLQRIDFK